MPDPEPVLPRLAAHFAGQPVMAWLDRGGCRTHVSDGEVAAPTLDLAAARLGLTHP